MADEDYPEFFYKYRQIENLLEPEKNTSIQALLSGKAYFSSRTNFNDIFDSKMSFVRPTPRQMKNLRDSVKKSEREQINSYIADGKFTHFGNEFLDEIEEKFNILIDSYPFFCVSSNSTSNLMWSHYASSHKGFCIEFRSKHVQASRVTYQEQPPQLKVIDMLRCFLKITDGTEISEHIWKSLKIKNVEWSYEKEYRYQAGNEMGKVSPKGKAIEVGYTSDFIEAIIFGCRMPENVKLLIAERMPSHVQLKQAIECTNYIEIIPSKIRNV